MATLLQLFIILTSISVLSTSIVSSVEDEDASTSPLPPPPAPSSISQEDKLPPSSDLLRSILTNLGFNELSDAASSLSTSTTTSATIFAPTDSSLLTCNSCSVPLLLQEHTVPGIYSLHRLRNLAFGTKIVTLVAGKCITITSADNSTKIFVGGAEITHPDLYNDGAVAVHGVQGFISHLSPFSCEVERMTSLSFPLSSPPMEEFLTMRRMLKDAMLRLRISGYSVLALALRVNYAELLDLRNVTVFALDDEAIFSSGGHEYVSELRFHIVPNRILMATDLESLPEATALPTMERGGERLVVTTAGGGGPLAPMRINYVKIRSFDMVHNIRIVIHGLSMPFRRVNQTADETGFDQIERSGCDARIPGIGERVGPVAGIESTAEMYCHDRRHDLTH